MDLVTTAFNELSEDVKVFFQTLIVLYHRPGFFQSLWPCRNNRNRGRMPRPEYFHDLHTFIKTEKADDFKFTQSILSSLPKENMQLYFHERNADTEY